MIPALLFYKIMQLAVFMLFGFVLVKMKIIRSQDSMILSKISLYLLMPSAIINAFDVELTADITRGLTLAFAAAILMHIILLAVDLVYKKALGGTCVERASIIYSNAANLIIPIVAYVLGEEWVIYSCAFMTVQLVFLWTQGVQLFYSRAEFDIKKILLNVNVVAIAFGAVFMILGIRLPGFVKEITVSLGDMLGVVGMIIAGMLAANVDFRKMLANKRLYLVLAMRMVICPLVMLVVVKGMCEAVSVANAEKILLISFLASITPSAATIMQFAQIHNRVAHFAVAINIVTTLACIVTMPLFVALYQS